jgi:long-chain fatty acid transport protein
VPNLFYARKLNDQWWIGYGLTAPFGLGSDYGESWFGRHDSTKTKLKTINHSLVGAYKINDRLSVGGGLDIQQAEAKLDRNAVAAQSGGGNTLDARTSLKGDDISVGWNMGALVAVNDQLDIGAHYRSAMSHTLDGNLRIAPPAGPGVIQAGTADLNLPDIASIGAVYDINEMWKIMGSVSWFGWSNFEEIRLIRAGLPDDVTTQGYEDTWAFNIGAEYQYSPDWVFRGGFQYDPTPTVDEFRTSRTPDGDRTWISAGATHKINDTLSLDLAATHIFITEETINVTRAGAVGGASSNVRANTEGSVSIFAAALKYKF